MGFSDAAKFGEALGRGNRDAEDTKQQITPNDPSSILNFSFFERIGVLKHLLIRSREIAGIWRIGHPVYGEIPVYPIGFPIVLDYPVYGELDTFYLTDEAIFEYETIYEA